MIHYQKHLIKTIQYILKKQYKDSLLKHYKDKSRHPENYTEKDKRKINNLNKFKKYETDDVHCDRTEYEADAYSRANTNSNQIKRAVRNVYKHANSEKGTRDQIKDYLKTKKPGKDASDAERNAYNMMRDLKLSREYINYVRNESNKLAQKDMLSRSKAAKDKSIDTSVYRESIDDIDDFWYN